MMYTCPVCGFNELPYPPEDWMICPCCNTMFGYSDVQWGNDVLRKEWIQTGAKWGSDDISQPEYWSPIQQLLNIGYHVSDSDKIAIASMSENDINKIRFMSNNINTVLRYPVRMLDDQENLITRFFSGRYSFEQKLSPVDSLNIL